ncbi:hypothetical protein LOZ36_006790 [Ophidiomyces ophidiicola]|nr:hypothetical protein LOZ36_006790 [Ophidiomyces ophidiicola]
MIERSTNLDSRNYFLLTISAKTFCNNMSLQFSDVYVKAKNFQNSLVLLAEYFEFTCTKKLQEFLTQKLMASILSPFKTLHAKSFELKGVNNEKKKTVCIDAIMHSFHESAICATLKNYASLADVPQNEKNSPIVC